VQIMSRDRETERLFVKLVCNYHIYKYLQSLEQSFCQETDQETFKKMYILLVVCITRAL